MSRYIPKRPPTEKQKATAHDFYRNTDPTLRDDLPWEDDRVTGALFGQAEAKQERVAFAAKERVREAMSEASDTASAQETAEDDGEGLPVSSMRGQITDRGDALKYIQAGNATVTLVSKGSGKRFTYRFRRPKEENGKNRPIWVSLLSGPDNEASYSFLGTIFIKDGILTYWHGRKSHVGKDVPSVKAVEWLLGELQRPFGNKFDQCEFWHEGRCCRCGRKLTVPSSVESGIGPECAKRGE